MTDFNTFIGMDVHKETIALAINDNLHSSVDSPI